MSTGLYRTLRLSAILANAVALLFWLVVCAQAIVSEIDQRRDGRGGDIFGPAGVMWLASVLIPGLTLVVLLSRVKNKNAN